MCNKNGILFDEEKFMIILGICLGMFVGISCGFGCEEFKFIGEWIGDVLDGLVVSLEGNLDVE